jgi:hypothetical protein
MAAARLEHCTNADCDARVPYLQPQCEQCGTSIEWQEVAACRQCSERYDYATNESCANCGTATSQWYLVVWRVLGLPPDTDLAVSKAALSRPDALDTGGELTVSDDSAGPATAALPDDSGVYVTDCGEYYAVYWTTPAPIRGSVDRITDATWLWGPVLGVLGAWAVSRWMRDGTR